jgi:hypothetical protein
MCPAFRDLTFPTPTVVIDSAGALHVTCYGPLPAGFSVPQTFVGAVLCRGDEGFADTIGRIVATKGGQVMITCKFDAPSA